MKKLVILTLAASLAMVGFSSSAASPSFQRSYEALATGAQEVPPIPSRTRGRVNLGFAPNLAYARYRVDVFRGTGVMAAHLHCAGAGENGPIVATLFADDPTDINDTLTSGYLTSADIEEQDGAGECPVVINNIASLRNAVHEGLIYVNVHTEDNPLGEVRGQLWPGNDGRP